MDRYITKTLSAYYIKQVDVVRSTHLPASFVFLSLYCSLPVNISCACSLIERVTTATVLRIIPASESIGGCNDGGRRNGRTSNHYQEAHYTRNWNLFDIVLDRPASRATEHHPAWFLVEPTKGFQDLLCRDRFKFGKYAEWKIMCLLIVVVKTGRFCIYDLSDMAALSWRKTTSPIFK